eukprot:TRINITY_DN17081_c0_g1_i1.p2 TRINITY_DN17081_c0_g1~~TRINITY_DN17081_c0_g1_i1.p2  ORF type:complete len:58 (+),score=9.99 TRINITY_DN17081_c0_g1_i1:396-569(+)
MTYDDCVPEEQLDEILEIIGGTRWTTPLIEIQDQRSRLYDILGIKNQDACYETKRKS